MDMSECIFCNILAKTAPADLLYEDDEVIVIRDVHPIAPVHLLIIPRRHIASLNELQPEDAALAGHLLLTVPKVARQFIGENASYRTVINTGAASGQTVFHLHVHIIAGRPSVSNLFTRRLH